MSPVVSSKRKYPTLFQRKMALVPGFNCEVTECYMRACCGPRDGDPVRCIGHKHTDDVRFIGNQVRDIKSKTIKSPTHKGFFRPVVNVQQKSLDIESTEIVEYENETDPEKKVPIKPYTRMLICRTNSGSREEFIEKLREHQKKHKCPYNLCKFRCKTDVELREHVNRHEGIKPFKCKYDWCDYRGTTYVEVERHIERFHSRKGFLRNLTQESHIIRKLKQWGLDVDTDVTIDASRNGCLNDTARLYSKVDIVIPNVTSCILILEIDEFSHETPTYNVSCEISRISDINAFLRLNSYTQPIFWLRYNPNGKYFVGEEEKIIPREKRELALKAKIFSMMEPDFVPDGHENIHYMFYSRISASGSPKILQNSEFPEYVKNIVSWGE